MTNQLVLENQFGEVSINKVGDESNYIGPEIAANTLVGNLTASAAQPTANTYAAVAAKLPCAMLLTGLAAGTNTAILAGDTLLVALAKLQAQIDAL